MPRQKMYDWVLPVAFTSEQSDVIERYADKHGVTYREAVRQIFTIGAACIAVGGRRVDISALLSAGAGR